MRLTLRTLLSYLDDTLEPAQAKAIGAKVAESEQARELIERIKQVTRRRRLTAPPTSGPGGIDANTIAEYLDNDVTAEKAAEVEQICLASDVHLAEVAACHQILTLVLGEPVLVPPSAKQRMVGLVKGPESIPSRKPAKTQPHADLDLQSEEIDGDQDETLRLGVPAVGLKSIPHPVLLFVSGGVLAVCLFGFAVWRLIHTIPATIDDPKENDLVAQGDKELTKKIEPAKDDDKSKPPVVNEEKIPPPKKKSKLPEIKTVEVVPVKIEPPPRIPLAEASKKQVPVGHNLAPGSKEPAVLLQAKPDKSGWTRTAGKNAPVMSGRMLLSLPGSKNVVALDAGVELTLWGNLPEVTLDPLLSESRATVHAHDILDVDMTLDRGRVILRNTKKTPQDALIRVRFNNPTLAEENHFDIVLNPGAAIVIERFCEMDREEPFYEDPKDPLRQGPTATMRVFGYALSATIRSAQVSYSVDETRQPIVQWQSRQGVLTTPPKTILPPWFKGTPILKDKGDQMARDKAVEAHDYLARIMEKDNKQIDVALAEIVQRAQEAAQKEIDSSKEKQISVETYVLWRHAIRCSAAIDDVANLFDAFAQDTTPLFIRGACMMTLQQWLALSRDHDYQLLEVVRKANPDKKTASNKIMELFHSVSTEDARKQATYQRLIEGLNNDLLPIRTLSHWHLFNLAPAGREIPYDPAMPRLAREAAVRDWTRLIPPGQLPPPGMPPVKKEKG